MMFPDSCIAQNYQMPSTRVIYVIRHDIFVHVKSMVGLSLLNSMNPQHVKNHYDRHIVGLYLLLNALMLM